MTPIVNQDDLRNTIIGADKHYATLSNSTIVYFLRLNDNGEGVLTKGYIAGHMSLINVGMAKPEHQLVYRVAFMKDGKPAFEDMYESRFAFSEAELKEKVFGK